LLPLLGRAALALLIAAATLRALWLLLLTLLRGRPALARLIAASALRGLRLLQLTLLLGRPTLALLIAASALRALLRLLLLTLLLGRPALALLIAASALRALLRLTLLLGRSALALLITASALRALLRLLLLTLLLSRAALALLVAAAALRARLLLLLLLLGIAALLTLLWLLSSAALAPALLTLLVGSATLGARLLALLSRLLALLLTALPTLLLALRLTGLLPLLLTLLLARLLALLLARLLALLARRSLPCCGLTLACTSGGTRRIVAEPALLAGGKRLRRRHLAGGPDDGLGHADRLPNCHLPALKVLRSHFHGTTKLHGSGQDPGTHIVRPQGPSHGRRNEGRRNPRIDRDPLLADHDRAVLDHCFTNESFPFARRHQYGGNARRSEIADPNENPDLGFLAEFHHDLLGRQGRPTDMLGAAPPLHPARTPFLSRNPSPSQIRHQYPPAVVIGDPAPGILRLVRGPVPAPVVGIDPMTDRVGLPVTRPICRNPDIAPA